LPGATIARAVSASCSMLMGGGGVREGRAIIARGATPDP
jgi:hypothetical protein